MNFYPSYKPSHIPWIGEIPEHWELVRMKFIANVLSGATPKSEIEDYWDGTILWITTDDLGKLTGKEIRTTNRKISKEGYESCGTKMAPEGSIVISSRAPIGHLAILGAAACTNQGCKTIVSQAENSFNFLYYYLFVAKEDLKSLGKGTTFTELPTYSLQNYTILQPPTSEQTAIASFLDRKTAEIDQLITDKERLIELYEEEKQAFINEAVTKGLDPHVKMKDSGIDWLGEVPTHWEVKRLKFIAYFQRGHDLPISDFGNGKVPVYGSNGVIGYHDSYTTEGPSITIGRSGSVGEVHFVPFNFWAHNTSLYLINNFGNDVMFLYFLLKSLDLKSFSAGTAVGTLNRNNIHEINLAVPTNIIEQKEIVRQIKSRLNVLALKIIQNKKQIDLYKEYRQALIFEAVTGKVDVRNQFN